MSTAASTSSCIQHRMESTTSPFELLARTAQQLPSHTALEFLPDDLEGAPLKLSYRQLLQEVQTVAAALKATGIREDESVAILLPFVPQAVSALIAASAVAVAFPVNLLLSAEAIRSQLTIARCRVVVTMGAHPSLDVHARVMRAVESMAVAPTVVEVPLAGPARGALAWEEFIRFPASGFEPVGSPDRIGALVHTGGTTGHPKLARLSLRNVATAAFMASAGLGIRPSERLLTGLPLFHVGGAIDALMAALSVGATVVFPSPLGMRNPAVVQRIWEIIARYRISLLGVVPTSLAAFRDSPRGISDLGRFRAIMTGGSPLSEDLALHLQAWIGKPIYQLYGMTESSGIATAQLISGRRVAHAAGAPAPGVEISLGEPGAEYRPGAKGEILIRGPNVFQGYLTAQGVIDDPQGGWFSSGDLGEVAANGELRIVGRSKDVIIRSGHNIDPQVIEDVAHRHTSVAHAAAVAMPDDYAGEVPVLFVVARAGTAFWPSEFSSFVAQQIAEPPARPKHIFVLDELPLTPFGKVARYRLRQLAVEYKVRELLAEVIDSPTVTCSDPAARCVAIDSGDRLTAAQMKDIDRILRRFDLQVEG
ncbi:AMP-binding protein [Pseudomonas jinjuensis]|uniref:Fatty-acyl-CoA synthase n=1 Tax=Pseudomonas jinjuensis TaxID=198616 RepID=A0A1H0EE09_9PSED|nr:AMP-binding protein [Pseudomonas jinjuensis]SDN80549.1 fatty-acyl-CoA synthase [Pseudomonas jinjuensis]